MGAIIPIEVPSDEELGPAMRALPTDKMRRFVLALMIQGDDNHSRAAAAAGYEGNPDIWKVAGYRLMRDERILKALHEETTRRLHAGRTLGVSALLKIAGNEQHKNHYQAVIALLDRVGFHASSEHKVTVDDHRKTDAEIRERIQLVASELGIDPQVLLGRQAVPALPAPIDAEFEVVGSTEGLEDVL